MPGYEDTKGTHEFLGELIAKGFIDGDYANAVLAGKIDPFTACEAYSYRKTMEEMEEIMEAYYGKD